MDFENLPQIGDCLVPAERQERDFLPGIISRCKEGKALDVVPVKVREDDKHLFLLVADGTKVSTQISQSRARVNDGDAVRISERDLQTRGVAPELLKTGIADRDGSPRTVKLELHRIVFMKASCRIASIKQARYVSCSRSAAPWAERSMLAQTDRHLVSRQRFARAMVAERPTLADDPRQDRSFQWVLVCR